SNEPSPHDRWTAFGLSILLICGAGGIHRFYVGKIGTGILWLLTGGLLGIGQLIDVIMICTGNFRDAQGRALMRGDDDEATTEKVLNQAAPAPATPPPPASAIEPAADAKPQAAAPA